MEAPIRIILSRDAYIEARIKLLERMCPLVAKTRLKIKGHNFLADDEGQDVLEGYLKDIEKLKSAGIRLSNKPIFTMQDDADVKTYLIEDGEFY